MSLLAEGDVIEIVEGHTIYIELPNHFVFENRVGCFDQLSKTEVMVGKPKKGMDTKWLTGKYVVISTSFEGGGAGHGPHDIYPDGHLVKAEKLEANDYDHRTKISFYQTGSFTAMIRDIKPIGKAKAKWSMG